MIATTLAPGKTSISKHSVRFTTILSGSAQSQLIAQYLQNLHDIQKKQIYCQLKNLT